MQQVAFATGNPHKFYEASSICAKYDIELMQTPVEIDEIQHHDSIEITRAKAVRAYEIVGMPVVANDSSWSIPALGGFPGGYMKDVSAWLRVKDFKALMQHQDDKRMLLTDTVVYYDGIELTVFSHQRTGRFLTDLEVDLGARFDSLVQMDSEPGTIAEILQKGDWDVSSGETYRHWYDFAKWYSQKKV